MAKHKGDAQHTLNQPEPPVTSEPKATKEVEPEAAGFDKYFAKDDAEKLIGFMNGVHKFCKFNEMEQNDIFRHTSYATHVRNVIIPKMKKLTIESMTYHPPKDDNS